MTLAIDSRLQAIKIDLTEGQSPPPVTVRTLLSWVGAQRRGVSIVWLIRAKLAEYGLDTNPDFENVYIDTEVAFLLKSPAEQAVEAPTSDQWEDPTIRVSRLSSASGGVVSVVPDATVTEAVTVMLLNDYSQLPVMQSEFEVKGVVSWRSIGKRLTRGELCEHVRDCMERHHEVPASDSLFDVIEEIISREYVLVRADSRQITGIVTTADLSKQFRELGEPFLLLGEVENHLRALLAREVRPDELTNAKDPGDDEREVRSVADLTFGEHLRLLENNDMWGRLDLRIDRKPFVEALHRVRRIRNDVMHFDPDGTAPEDLLHLRNVVSMLHDLRGKS